MEPTPLLQVFDHFGGSEGRLGDMAALLALAAFIPFAIAAGNYWSAHLAVQSVIPPHFRDNWTERFTTDVYVWSNQVPDSARCRYVRSFFYMAMAMVLMGLALLANGNTVGAVLFGAVSTITVAQAFVRWLKYRRTCAQ